MKLMKIAALAAAGSMVLSTAAFADGAADTYGIDKDLTVGVLVSDTTSSEALAFQSYYKDYLASQYKVNFIYSDELKDAAGETTALDLPLQLRSSVTNRYLRGCRRLLRSRRGNSYRSRLRDLQGLRHVCRIGRTVP